ncbi:MAG: redox-regulated ATPase YchF [Chloroflexi bacterium]|nr:redox-regulated ATPase YchF [Chloroflexota bacterium]MCI0896890.1 redox-regulated ATPase YchF [Chloroflexota bacterium]MCI0899533.1 redox-regulated ATPase YchF [Chloroflexota bacterium]
MDIAIIGLPQSGKSTVFNALTGGHSTSTGAGGAGPMQIGVVKVIDPRLAVLEGMYHPKKVIHPEIKYWDLPPIDRETASANQILSGRQRNILQAADALLLVVRAFEDPALLHPMGGVDPGRDVKVMLEELALADLEALERAEARLSDGLKKAKPAERSALVPQLEAVQKVKAALEDGIPMKSQTLTPSETAALADFQLLTAKPVMITFNTGESEATPTLEGVGILKEVASGLGEVGLCAKLEEDLAMMEPGEAEEFREAMGLDEPAVERVKQVCYSTVGLVSFLTVGEDEVRAWPVPAGIVAQMAAGTIHTDFTRGFIRAEVIPYDDLVRCGSLAQGRKEGVLRSEGKTYEVKDGDVINFLINT